LDADAQPVATRVDGSLTEVLVYHTGGKLVAPPGLPYYSLGGRLSSARESRGDNNQQSWLVNYDYDVFGDRYQKHPRDQEFRQLKFHYDANNRQKQSSNLDDTGVVMSVYDAGGQRVATQVGGVLTNVCVYDAMGKLLAEYGAPSADPGGTSYLMSDHQGSPRVVTNTSGAVISRHDYLAFSEELGTVGMRTSGQGYGIADATRQKYAGMESDDGSGMATTLWRKYDSSSGRWTSPDPYTASMTIANPQSFNR
jgi:RHS repeat-associated protein